MIVLYALVLSLVVALLRGGSLKRLGELQIRQMWLVFVPGALIVALLVVDRCGYGSIARTVSGPLHVLSMVLFLAVAWLNRRLAGAYLLALGLLLNLAPLAANGGRMPASYAAAERCHDQQLLRLLKENSMQRHVTMSRNTRLKFLSDIIGVPRPLGPEVMSIGDIVLALGVLVLVQGAMVRKSVK